MHPSRHFLLVCISILAFALVTFLAADVAGADELLTKTYKNPDIDFSFRYPEKWILTEDGIGKASVMTPDSDGVYVGFSSTPEATKPSEITKEMLDQSGYNKLDGFQWISFSNTTFKSMDAVVSEFRLDETEEGSSTDLSMKLKQYIFSDGINTYMATICAPADLYDKYETTFESIMNSFEK